MSFSQQLAKFFPTFFAPSATASVAPLQWGLYTREEYDTLRNRLNCIEVEAGFVTKVNRGSHGSVIDLSFKLTALCAPEFEKSTYPVATLTPNALKMDAPGSFIAAAAFILQNKWVTENFDLFHPGNPIVQQLPENVVSLFKHMVKHHLAALENEAEINKAATELGSDITDKLASINPRWRLFFTTSITNGNDRVLELHMDSIGEPTGYKFVQTVGTFTHKPASGWRCVSRILNDNHNAAAHAMIDCLNGLHPIRSRADRPVINDDRNRKLIPYETEIKNLIKIAVDEYFIEHERKESLLAAANAKIAEKEAAELELRAATLAKEQVLATAECDSDGPSLDREKSELTGDVSINCLHHFGADSDPRAFVIPRDAVAKVRLYRDHLTMLPDWYSVRLLICDLEYEIGFFHKSSNTWNHRLVRYAKSSPDSVTETICNIETLVLQWANNCLIGGLSVESSKNCECHEIRLIDRDECDDITELTRSLVRGYKEIVDPLPSTPELRVSMLEGGRLQIRTGAMTHFVDSISLEEATKAVQSHTTWAIKTEQLMFFDSPKENIKNTRCSSEVFRKHAMPMQRLAQMYLKQIEGLDNPPERAYLFPYLLGLTRDIQATRTNA